MSTDMRSVEEQLGDWPLTGGMMLAGSACVCLMETVAGVAAALGAAFTEKVDWATVGSAAIGLAVIMVVLLAGQWLALAIVALMGRAPRPAGWQKLRHLLVAAIFGASALKGLLASAALLGLMLTCLPLAGGLVVAVATLVGIVRSHKAGRHVHAAFLARQAGAAAAPPYWQQFGISLLVYLACQALFGLIVLVVRRDLLVVAFYTALALWAAYCLKLALELVYRASLPR